MPMANRQPRLTAATNPVQAVQRRKSRDLGALHILDENAGTMTLDHLGIAVRSLEEAIPFYEGTLGLKVSGYETVAQEQTRVAMIPLADTRIELLEPTSPDSPIAHFLAKRGPG